MKASEMTNEELADKLIETTGRDPLCQCNRYVLTREAAARLRSVDDYAEMCGDAMKEVAVLRAKLKAAEDALELCIGGMCGECHRQNHEGTCVCPNGCYEMSMAKNALAAIRREGGAK